MCSQISSKISIATIKPQYPATNTSPCTHPVSHRRQPIRIEAYASNRVVIAKHIPENHRSDLIPRHPMRRNPVQLILLQRRKKVLHSGVIIAMMHTVQALDHAMLRLCTGFHGHCAGSHRISACHSCFSVAVMYQHTALSSCYRTFPTPRSPH